MGARNKKRRAIGPGGECVRSCQLLDNLPIVQQCAVGQGMAGLGVMGCVKFQRF